MDKIKVKKNNFAWVKVYRNGKGLTIRAKSKRIEKFFRDDIGWAVSEYKSNHSAYSNLQCYSYPPNAFADFFYPLTKWGEDIVISGTTNLSFLRTVGLENGITLTFPGVFSKEVVEKIAGEIHSGLKEFYSRYIREKEIEIIVNERATRIVER